MNERRVLFESSPEGFTYRLSHAGGGDAVFPQPFELFLTGDDVEDLRWYLEELMDLPDGGSRA
ncbi:MAG: hypothetical protein ABI193_03560 [Minicystis sp.]